MAMRRLLSERAVTKGGKLLLNSVAPYGENQMVIQGVE
jgi:hypothetical protein